jgi:hypothetical protein
MKIIILVAPMWLVCRVTKIEFFTELFEKMEIIQAPKIFEKNQSFFSGFQFI